MLVRTRAGYTRKLGGRIAASNITMNAKNDSRIRGSAINAQGDLTVKAEEVNVCIEAGSATLAVAGTALKPYLDQMATSAGLSGAAHGAVVAELAGVLGGALGSSAGSTAAFNEANNNWLTSRDVNYLADNHLAMRRGRCSSKDAVRAEAKWGMGVTRPNTPSAVPGMVGNVFSSGAQEAVGNPAKGVLQREQEK